MESRNDESATNQVNTRRIGAFPMYDDICRSTNKEAFLRHVVHLAHQSGYTYAEIADYMGIAKTTIKRAYRSCAYDHHYLGESKPRYSLRETWSMC
jgi:uncharacterized protein YerC